MPVARGRHAPPLEIRLPHQRARLLNAAAQEFAANGYVAASAESISRRAAMSKATFYEHFADKLECMLALREDATQMLYEALWEADRAPGDPVARMRASVAAFTRTFADRPDLARAVLVEIVGAGPRAGLSRDRILQAFAEALDRANERAAALGLIPRFASSLDSIAFAGAAVELVSRQLRLGVPARISELEPVLQRMLSGLLSSADQSP